MALALTLIVAAIVLGIVGLVVKALKWALIIAVIVFLVGLFRGFMARRTTSR